MRVAAPIMKPKRRSRVSTTIDTPFRKVLSNARLPGRNLHKWGGSDRALSEGEELIWSSTDLIMPGVDGLASWLKLKPYHPIPPQFSFQEKFGSTTAIHTQMCFFLRYVCACGVA